eukprot:TRINITY_DN1635_c0_g2_i1.p1 TRINITY_DN1635_c0_g2~~TRINITY_DN1635_c0_g2_i1.p1  ORF type:complete len:344 (+),score=95.50 TRINITY_DN1635_c0_g2_i1:127-1158(+)
MDDNEMNKVNRFIRIMKDKFTINAEQERILNKVKNSSDSYKSFWDNLFDDEVKQKINQNILLQTRSILTKEVQSEKEFREGLKKLVAQRFKARFKSVVLADFAQDALISGFETFFKNLLATLCRLSLVEADSNGNLLQRRTGSLRDYYAGLEGEYKKVFNHLTFREMNPEDELSALDLKSVALYAPRAPAETHRNLMNHDSAAIKNIMEQYINRPQVEKKEGEEKLTKRQKMTNETFLMTEIYKSLIKATTDKSKDKESSSRNLEETNRTLGLMMDQNMMGGGAGNSAREAKKHEGKHLDPTKQFQNLVAKRRITYKHVMFFLENDPHFRRSNVTYKSYFKQQ